MHSLSHLFRKQFITLNFNQWRTFQKLEVVYPKPSVESTTKNIIEDDTIKLLERLSLVDCVNKKDIETLEAAIDFADQIFEVDTTAVAPLVTVLED